MSIYDKINHMIQLERQVILMTNIQTIINELSPLDYKNIKNQKCDSVTYDSRKAISNSVFVAIRGFKVDGHKFIPSAIENGCTTIVCENYPENIDPNIAFIRVSDSREALGICSKTIYDDFSDKMPLIGITGTNGKTSSTYLLQGLFETAGEKIGFIGTNGVHTDGVTTPLGNTTPESSELYKLFSKMHKNGTNYAFMEVSSHATVLKRIQGLKYKVGIFTNLTEDHLIFHKTMENYYNAKKDFFNSVEHCVINIDDEYGQRLYRELLAEDKKVYSYSLKKDSDFRAEILEASLNGSVFRFTCSKGSIDLTLSLPGIFNIQNALGVIGAGIICGLNLETIKRGFANLKGIPGRFESLETTLACTVILDFAHTPDGLEKVMQTIEALSSNRKIALFGAQGERDKARRGQMGKISGKYADITILTEDNPVFEDPKDICLEIAEGVKSENGEFKIIVDRSEAINYVIKNHLPGDIIVLAGKSTEPYQIVGDKKIPYSERDIAIKALREAEKI
jgi:UDP-N-acetylmuramoyl-L-alanyl-D-glutamate--2,6-diaminopimelate ligase